MTFLNQYLAILGLRSFFFESQNNFLIDTEFRINYYDFYIKKFNIKKFLQIFYFTFLIFVLAFESAIIGIDIHYSKQFEPYIFFSLIPFVNYLIGIKYYSTNKLEKIILKNKMKNKNICTLTEKKIVVYSILFSLFILIPVLTLFFHYNDNDEFNNIQNLDYSNNIKIFFTIFIVINWIYAINILLVNILVFFYTFCYLILELKNTLNFITNKNIWDEETIFISSIIQAINEVKYEINFCIEGLNSFYSLSTILACIGIGTTIHYETYTSYTISWIVIFGLSQLLFLYIIYSIEDEKSKLINFINEPNFSLKFLKRKLKTRDLNTIYFNSELDNEINTSDNYNKNDDFKVKRKLSQFIDEIDDKNDLTNKQKLNDNLVNQLSNEDNLDIELQNIKIIDENTEGNIHLTPQVPGTPQTPQTYERKILKEILENEKEENRILKKIEHIEENSFSSLDWIILNSILKQDWKHFNLFGINFDGVSGLQKAIGLTTLFITLSNYISSIEFF
jgi:hypothetical protein